MRMSHVHCRVRDLQAATRWFERVWQIAPVFNNERMAWLPFGDLGVILDAAPDDSIVTIGFDSKDCDAHYRLITSRGAEPIEAPQDKPWGARTAYLRGPGGLTVEIERIALKRAARINAVQPGRSCPSRILSTWRDKRATHRCEFRKQATGPPEVGSSLRTLSIAGG